MEETALESVQNKLFEELLTKILVEGILPFYITPVIESDQFEAETYKACYTIGFVVDALKPALINCAPSVSD